MKLVEVHPGYKAMSDEQLAEHIRERLGMHPAWARRALLALYDEQTEAEKADPTVHESNGRGFSPNDQEFLSSLAEQALRGETFSQKQIGWLYKLLPKYSKQMVKIVRELQKLEKATVLTLYHAQITIDNSMKMMKGSTGELNMDARDMPDEILLRSPSGEMMNTFKLSEVYAPEGKVTTFLYKGVIDAVDWILYIVDEEKEELPQWAQDMSKAMGLE